jgi:hypothetical protein
MSEVKRTYLLAMFLHRPDPRFEFNHVSWQVEFYGVVALTYKAKTAAFLDLNRLQSQLEIPETCPWEQACLLASRVIHGFGFGIDGSSYYLDAQKIKHKVVNWQRDGF